MMILCASVATVNHALPSMSLAADMLRPIKRTSSWTINETSNGMYVLAMSGAILDQSAGRILLRHGTVFLRSPRIGSLRTDTADTWTFGGTIGIIRDQSSTTVIGIDAPVAVRVGTGVTLIGPKSQLVLRKDRRAVSDVPDVWFDLQRDALAALTKEPFPLDATANVKPADQREVFVALRESTDNVARMATVSKWMNAYPLRYIDAQDVPMIAAILDSVDPSIPLREFFALAALKHPQSSDTTKALASLLIPCRRYQQAFSTVIMQMVKITNPPSDVLPAVWSSCAGNLAIDDATNTLLRSLADFVEKRGYPRIASLWRERATDSVAIVSVGAASSSVAPSASTVSSFASSVPPRAALAVAKASVQAAGLLLSTDSVFDGITEIPNTVDVRHVLVVAKTGEYHDLSFSLDVTTSIASRIVMDGRALPNAVALSALAMSL
jgi:hypothetical protein